MASQSSDTPSIITTRRSTFQFEIDYSKARKFPIGEFVSSPRFNAGGYDWCLDYFPRREKIDGISNYTFLDEKAPFCSLLYLRLQSEVKKISVEYSSQVLDNKGKFIDKRDLGVVNFGYNRARRRLVDCFYSIKTARSYCVNGIFVISCSIRVLNDPKVVQTYPGGLCEHIQKLWEKKDNFDVTFEVEGENISAHRLMLVARSPVFATELFGPMAEAKEEHIKIDEMKAELFRALLHFVYTDQLPKYGTSNRETLSVELLQGLFVAADRYALDKLTLLCEEKLENNLSVDTAITTLLLADRHSHSELKKKCLDFASSPDNFSLVALTEGYLSTMLESPHLLAELSEKVKRLFHSAKKLRTD